MFTNLNLTDMETCYKVFPLEVLQSLELVEDRFGFEPEVTAKLAAGGPPLYEVGISYSGRTYAQGKKIGWSDGFCALYCIARYSAVGSRLRRKLIPVPTTASDSVPSHLTLALAPNPFDALTNYAERIGRLIQPWLGQKVVEISAGTGAMTERLAKVATMMATDR